jgi:hypothetical protein
MGLRLQGPLRCGACGKPRSLFGTHACPNGRRRRRRTTVQNPIGWRCRTCGQDHGPWQACSQRSDFKSRKRKAAADEKRRKRKTTRERQAARRRQAAAERRARDRARKQAAKTRPRVPRPKGDSHEPGSCGDRDCPRYGCKHYWRGMDDCPRAHEGE